MSVSFHDVHLSGGNWLTQWVPKVLRLTIARDLPFCHLLLLNLI